MSDDIVHCNHVVLLRNFQLCMSKYFSQNTLKKLDLFTQGVHLCGEARVMLRPMRNIKEFWEKTSSAYFATPRKIPRWFSLSACTCIVRHVLCESGRLTVQIYCWFGPSMTPLTRTTHIIFMLYRLCRHLRHCRSHFSSCSYTGSSS